MGVSRVQANDILTAPDVTMPLHSNETIEIGCEFNTQFIGFQMDIVVDDGLSLIVDIEGKPICEKGFINTDHTVYCSQISPSTYRFIYVSLTRNLLPLNGTLLRVNVCGAETLCVGDTLDFCVTNIKFTSIDLTEHLLSDINSIITISKPNEKYIILDESSYVMPEASDHPVNVRLNRIINANEWSTIVLPFKATQTQVYAAFGKNVEFASFKSWESEKDIDGSVVGINLLFSIVDVTNGLDANVPLLIHTDTTVTTATFEGVIIEPEKEPFVQVGVEESQQGYFHGTYVKMKVPEDNLFLNEDRFGYSTGTTTTLGYSGYFELHDVIDGYDNGSDVKVYFDVDRLTTGLRTCMSLKLNTNLYFNLTGCRILRPIRHGVYILNGKKIILR